MKLLNRKVRDSILTAVETTFDALYSLLTGKWQQQDDIVYPFHGNRRADDFRHVLVDAVWTFDLDNDTLRVQKEKHSARVSLELVRRNPITTLQYESYMPLVIPESSFPAVYPSPSVVLRRQNLDLSHLRRRKALVSRLLNDFTFQWRHVLRGPCNNSTFRRLTYAIIRILALDFTIVETNVPRQGPGGFLVRLQDLPRWNMSTTDIVRVGAVSIAICQHLVHAESVISADFRKSMKSKLKADSTHGTDDFRTYLIFSTQEIFLYRISSYVERYTKPERLFEGTSGLNPRAVDLLLEATQQHTSTFPALPNELKDMILEKVTAGPLQRAKFGCHLNIGPIFDWKFEGRSIEREEGCRNRTDDTPVESKIWFDDCFSGLAYK